MYQVLSIKYLLFSILYTVCFILSTAPSAHAQASMKNSSYIIRMGNFNSAGGKSSGASGSLNITVGQISPGLYTGQNFKLKAGFQYYPSGTPFSLTISNTSIDFGTLEPTNPVSRSNILTVSNQSAGGYVVSAIEDQELKAKEGVFIPDTTCDNGTCSEQTAGKWSGSLVYGFGYR